MTETLAEAKQWLRDRVDKGARCPCCTQMTKVYRRKISHSSARLLVVAHQAVKNSWFHVPSLTRDMPGVVNQGGQQTIAHYWGLLEEERTKRGDGGRSGYWRVTDKGSSFVMNELSVPKYCVLYDGRPLRYEGEMVGIVESLGTKFNYRELMEGK